MTTDPNTLLQGHYKIKFNPTDKFNYTSIYQESIGLFLHQEVPQGYNFIEPRLSPNEKYLSIIGKGDYNDIVLIYDIDNLFEYKLMYKEVKIFGVDFAPDSRSFVIIYKNLPPIHYNITSGKKIVNFKSNNKEKNIPIAFTFSAKCRFFGLAYDYGFCIWDTLKGNVVKEIIEESDNKIIRDNLLISVKQNLNVNIRDFGNNEDKIIKNLTIRDENLNYDDILAMMLSPDLESIYFGNKTGIFKMDIESGDFDKIIEFDSDASSIKLSQSCKLGVSTNYKNIDFWNLEKKINIGSLFKEKFNSYSFNFQQEKLVISNDYCITILNYNDGETEKYIWLNKNPEKFHNFTFSPDFKVLLAYIDDKNAILYNCESGEIIRKFQNKDLLLCEMVPSSSDYGIVATKSDNEIIKIYNYSTGIELMSLSGFNTYSFSFSEKGDLLCCGCVKGEEICRVWNLQTNKFYSYVYNGDSDNKNTLVIITKNDEPKIICASEKQNPIVFDFESRNLLIECESPFIYEKIESISSSMLNKFFIVKGMDNSGQSQAVIFSLDDGKLIEEFRNCNCIHVGRDDFILSKSENKNNGKLTISDLSDFNNIQNINCEIDAEISNFLQDKNVIVSPFGSEDNMKFVLTDVSNGEIIGDIEYSKLKGKHAEIDLSANPEENTLIFTYIELIERVKSI